MEKNTKDEKYILVADASTFDRSNIVGLLKHNYPVKEANNGIKALEIFQENPKGCQLAVIDAFLPRMDGFSLLSRIRMLDASKKVPIVMMGIGVNNQHVLNAFRLGATDFIAKPIRDEEEFQTRMEGYLGAPSTIKGSQLSNLVSNAYGNQEVERQALKEYVKRAIKTVNGLFSLRKVETPDHLKRISLYTGLILKVLAQDKTSRLKLTEEQMDLVVQASYFHDIGKVALPDWLLEQHMGLTAKEKEAYRSHTIRGAEILALNNSPNTQIQSFIKLAQNIALNHHEHWDGSGYPKGKKEGDIPISAQIVGIATDFDKFTRGYFKSASPFTIGISRILQYKTRYNPRLIKAMATLEKQINSVIEKYPD